MLTMASAISTRSRDVDSEVLNVIVIGLFLRSSQLILWRSAQRRVLAMAMELPPAKIVLFINRQVAFV